MLTIRSASLMTPVLLAILIATLAAVMSLSLQAAITEMPEAAALPQPAVDQQPEVGGAQDLQTPNRRGADGAAGGRMGRRRRLRDLDAH